MSGFAVVRTYSFMKKSSLGLRVKSKSRSVSRVSNNPQSFTPTKTIRSTYRFQSSAALSRVAVTIQDLLDLLCVAESATVATGLCQGVKLQAAKIWGPMASSLEPVTVAIEYANSATVGAPTSLRSDTSMGSAKAAALSYPPPQGSLASLWLSSGSPSQTILYLTGPSGSIVDIVLHQVLLSETAAMAVSHAVSGATPGQVYVRALDSNGSGLLVPVEYPTI